MKDKHHQTCLYYTCREGKYETSKYLIEECGLPINEKDFYGQHPIYYAAREGKLNVCELLTEKGADVNLEDKFGQSCLYYAIRQGHYDVVDFLIKKGIDVNKVDKKKQTPVTYAEKLGQGKIVDLLVNNGGIRPEPKKKEKKEKKKEPNPEEEQMNKQEMINNIQQPKKNILVKITPNGDKIPLSEEEMEQFKKEYPDLCKLLYDKAELDKITSAASDDLKIIDSWEKIAKKLLNIVWKHKDAHLFHRPVNPIELGIDDYFDKIKHPMDFSTIKKKLNGYHYRNCQEFVNDMKLVFDNCYLYNGTESLVGHMCTNVKQEYEKVYTQLEIEKLL